MAKKEETPKAEQAFTPAAHDAFHGQGGSYVFDPSTGQRTRVEPAHAEEQAQ